MTAVLAALAALLPAGCTASLCDGCDAAYVQVFNDTDEEQHIYIDGWYAGALEAGEVGTWDVSCGWHLIEAYDEFGVFVDGFYVEAYCEGGCTFYWHIFLVLDPPAVGPAGEDCPLEQPAAAPLGPEPVAERF
jgi:hypothetical protein